MKVKSGAKQQEQRNVSPNSLRQDLLKKVKAKNLAIATHLFDGQD